MVQEQRVKQVCFTVNEIVEEKVTKRVPYQVCKMVPHTVCKKIAYTVCEQEKYTVCRKVAYTECVKQAYTVHCRVPYTVCETINCPVTKQVKVCVPKIECCKGARMVPVTVECDPVKACPDKVCGNECCEPKCRLMDRLRCKSTCTTTCKDTCHDNCREGLLQSVHHNRFCCEPTCDTGCTGTTGGSTRTTTASPMPPAEPIQFARLCPRTGKPLVIPCHGNGRPGIYQVPGRFVSLRLSIGTFRRAEPRKRPVESPGDRLRQPAAYAARLASSMDRCQTRPRTV